MNKQVFAFEEGDGKNKVLLGGKGANLCEMTQIGLNVPPGFVITTETCLAYLDSKNDSLPDSLMSEVKEQMTALEEKTGKKFGDASDPLLVSVRSGSAMSMPGMMDTILNLGLNSDTLKGEIQQTGDPRFAYDAYRRFIQLFGKVAMGIADEPFDDALAQLKNTKGIKEDIALSADDLEQLCGDFLSIVRQQTGRFFPEDPYEQLELAIKAVFGSWMGKRAIDYRREFNITSEMANGTAVNIVTMVFGNRGNDCSTGVAFTRNPGSGENRLYGEYLTNAQGEDVVAGIRTPKAIEQMAVEMPELYKELEELRSRLETHYSEIQDFEFTIERGVLYCLQTRNGKMNAVAMVRTSVEMEREGLISKKEALLRIDPQHLEQMLYPRLDPNIRIDAIAQGLPASPGAASGIAIFDADRAEQVGKDGTQVILLREETKPEDIHGFFASQGILTSRGGKTSHAAVVARGMGKPCVAGAEGISVDINLRQANIGDIIIKEGDWITLDGTSGNVYQGKVATVEADFTNELNTLLGWADEVAKLKVLANADTPADAAKAVKYGAMGVGLCRTERMFNDPERLPMVIEMIVAEDKLQRQQALDRLLPIQRADFKGLFEVMSPRNVTIRLLDPPIHEFLPSESQLRSEIEHLQSLHGMAAGATVLANTMSLLDSTSGRRMTDKIPLPQMVDPLLVEEAINKKQNMLKKVRALYETNPMLGHRGVRLGITFPEIYSMQIRAILEAAAECAAKGLDVRPQIMIPQVSTVEELKFIKEFTDSIHAEVEKSYNLTVNYKFGSMLEVVRACMRSESLAEVAEFFSFGTNDLSQATFSFSREDAENKFLPLYNERNILQDNPFEVLDREGVGKLMELAVNWGRSSRKGMSIGICGEHGGHPESIHFCHKIGLDYVSCSGPRVPIARLAVAHAALKG
ncbi:MAG: pyruvate, phosphate dikinase [gamma proteobacterium symbiont of Lucinoma myriamae]|nr:pyruvate, phosphate dikinase [gamma proteobacterium symbiont of Lucinoma myriamae]MCU7818434.1 pyruvate, phosphate dikinase [gamma proteobacterium symbiont of Lucinoma myriamae]MCU7831515.1 pyruvate, phosphate dikinase [gamma proteobacterium symbiont of Lucinoma myriamae]